MKDSDKIVKALGFTSLATLAGELKCRLKISDETGDEFVVLEPNSKTHKISYVKITLTSQPNRYRLKVFKIKNWKLNVLTDKVLEAEDLAKLVSETMKG